MRLNISMTGERWERIKQIFASALERDPSTRAAFLDGACAGDAEMRREVESLLAAHQTSDTFLEVPPATMAAACAPQARGLIEGQTLGPYCIVRTLGQGGMATVYLARDERHHRSVAVKVLLPELAHSVGPERFLREIEIAANLSHPHILPLHDSGEVAGLLYYVMPYVEGESLRDRLRRETQLPVEDALQIGREVADALAYAHGHGVIHRDIKPENILLSGGHALLHSQIPTPPAAEAVRTAAMRAVAVAPTRPEGHLALSKYYYNVVWDDPRGFTEDSIALALAPSNSMALKAMGWDELYLGRWDVGRAHLEQAVKLDPRSVAGAAGLATVLLYTRQYHEAEQTLDRLMQRAPANLEPRQQRAVVALAQGDLARAQAIINGVPPEVTPTALVANVATGDDLVWVLDQVQQQLLLRLRPSAFDDDRATWGLVFAQSYALRGYAAKARIYADSARLAFEQQLQASPKDPQRHALLGLALAYLGRKAEAIRQGERSVELMPLTRDAIVGPYLQHQLARIYLLVGEPQKALDQLELLLKIPGYLSPGWLRIDPNFAPLRGNPRFERLLEGNI